LLRRIEEFSAICLSDGGLEVLLNGSSMTWLSGWTARRPAIFLFPRGDKRSLILLEFTLECPQPDRDAVDGGEAFNPAGFERNKDKYGA